MAFTRIAPLIRIFDESKAKEFYVEFLGFNIDFEHRDSDDAPLYMQVSNYFHECHQYLTFVPKKKHLFHSISTPPELVELRWRR